MTVQKKRNCGRIGRKPLGFEQETVVFIADKAVLAVLDRLRGKRSRSAMIREIIGEWAWKHRRQPGPENDMQGSQSDGAGSIVEPA